jgi:acyl transferase domain-containing protein
MRKYTVQRCDGQMASTSHGYTSPPSQQVDWSSETIEVIVPWPDQTDRVRRAGVSAFDLSGTNAYVIPEQAHAEFATADSALSRSLIGPWVMSAKSASALGEQAVVGAPAPNVAFGKAAAARGTVFVFPGQGSWGTGMAVEPLDSAPAFVNQMRLCDAAFAEFVDWSLLEAVRGDVGSPSLDRVDVVQPVLFAVTVSLAAQWRALGIQPDAVLGHSQGEIAAAYVAGALSLRDAAKVVTLRSKAMSGIAGKGGMVAIPRPVQQVWALIEPWGQSICVAAQNGPSSTVVTGNAAALDELMAVCERDNLPAMRIPVNYASHSAHVEALRETLRESLSGLQPRTGEIVFISAVTGAGLDSSILDGDYWFANLRQPVLFEQAVRWAYEHGYRTFIESSRHPVLTVGIQESLEEYGDDQSVVGTLQRNEDGRRRFPLSAAEPDVVDRDGHQ